MAKVTELLKAESKRKYGSKWGLYFSNAIRKGKAIVKRFEERGELEKAFYKVPEDPVGTIAYSIILGQDTFSSSASTFTKDPFRQLVLNRTKKFSKVDEGFTMQTEKGENVYIKSPSQLYKEYESGEIDYNTYKEGLNLWHETYQAQNYKAYGG